MHPKIKRWIYVTGAPRSGTTFAGKILSSSIRVDYIHEPFNPDCGIAGIGQPYLYLERGSAREVALRPTIDALFDYKAKLRTGYYKNDTPFQRFAKRFVGSRGPFHLRLARLNPFHDAAIVKDPVGCLLTRYLAESYGVKPVIMVRRPVGFVASSKKLRWENSLDPIVNQPDLVARFFGDEEHELIERYGSGTPIEKAALTWRLLNTVLLAFHDAIPGSVLVTHEQLSEEPVATFERIFAGVGLPMTDRIRERIARHTSGDGKTGQGRVQRFVRDSKSIAGQSQSLLDADEKKKVMLIAEPLATRIYGN
ncbi:MAG TPA: sulfotransferase [Xanthomonadaceae bacterium]|jgi:hypothetical protein